MKKIISLLITITLLACYTPTYAMFTMLNQAKEYAQKKPEYIQTDNQNWLNPNFSSYHKKLRPNSWKRMLNFLHITQPEWSAKSFKKSLDELILTRELNGYIGRFIQKITPPPNTKFVIWGDLHGAFHSFIRDLQALSEVGALSPDFKVHEPYYFIFNGNVIDRSPYNLETLSLIMQLMINNPERVIYIMGSHENKQLWHNFDLARELQIRCAKFADKKLPLEQQIPLEKEISRFFNTLPLALYLTEQTNQKPDIINTIRISYFPRFFSEINEEEFAGFLDEKNDGKIKQFNLGQKNISPKKIVIKAIIKGEDRSTYFKPSEGLILLDPDKDSVAWSILSSPNGSHRREFDFFYDAFAQIITTKNMNTWLLELYNQDVRTMLGIKKTAVYNLVSGAQLDLSEQPQVITPPPPITAQKPTQNATPALQQVTPLTPSKHIQKPAITELPQMQIQQEQQATNHKNIDELVLGSAVGISRGLGPAGKAFANGIQLRIKQARENKEMGAVLPKIIIKDDQYNPEKTRSIIESFIQDNIDIIIAPPGSPTLASYYDLIKAGKVLVLFPSTGTPESHTSEYKYLLHYRGDDIFEGRVLAEYAATNLKAKNIILFIQDDEFGSALLKGAQETLKKHPNVKTTEIQHKRNELDFAKQIETIKQNKKFDTIIFLGITTAAQELVRQLGVEYLIGKNIIGNSDFSGEEISTFFSNKGIKLTKLSVVPNVETSTLPIVQQFKKAAKKGNISFDPFTLESYIATDIALELIKRVQGPITKEKIIAIAESIKNETHKGLTLSFIPEKRELGHPLWIVKPNDANWSTVKEVGDTIVIEN